MNDRKLRRQLSRLIRGELLSADLKRLARRQGCTSFSELCEARLPRKGLRRLRVGPREILARITGYRQGAVDRYELWYWANELYEISQNRRLAFERRCAGLVESVLSVLGVICNEGLFPDEHRLALALDYIRTCLLGRRKFCTSRVFLRAFEDLESAHLADKHLCGGEEGESDQGEAAWVQVVLLDRPFDAGANLFTDYNWVLAYEVTAGVWEMDDVVRPGKGRAGRRFPEPPPDPLAPGVSTWDEAQDEPLPLVRPVGAERLRGENGESLDRVPALRRLVPNFDFETYAPRYHYNDDGIAEIVLAADAVGPRELAYATKLFCLANRIRACRLDGVPQKTLLVWPGAGGDRRSR